jgi:hypothetical protein
MISANALWGVLSLLGCDTTTSIDGTVVDGMTGKPAGGHRLIATAIPEDAPLTCKSFEAEVKEDGTFLFDKLCGGIAYRVASDKEDLWLAEANELPTDDAAPPTELKIWRAPKTAGLYRLAADGSIEPLTTDADVKRETIRGSTEKVRYPSTIPKAVKSIGPDEHLVLVGQETIDRIQIHPLVASDTRIFGDDATKVTMDPWHYVGVTFTDDTTWTASTATIDSSKVIDKSKDDRVVRYIPGTAIPSGRYAALADDDVRMIIVDFGAPPADAVAGAAPTEPSAADATADNDGEGPEAEAQAAEQPAAR